jgi:uncharacterized membrane protein
MTKYRKLVMAIVGLAVLVIGPDFLGVVGVEIDPGRVTEIIIGILTAIGVWAVPNTPS